MTDKRLQILGDPSGNSYAIGDCADIENYALPCTAQVRSEHTYNTYVPGHVAQSVTFLTTDGHLTAYPVGREFHPGPVPIFCGD